MNPGYFPLAATALKPQQIHIFLQIAASGGVGVGGWVGWVGGGVGGAVISTDIRTVGLCVKTAIILQ